MSAPRRWVLWIVITGLVVFVALQLVPAEERTNPPVESDLPAPTEVKEVLRRACYDCHSHETHWPWYSYVAPLSWWIVEHVDHGRSDLNFSQWPALDFDAQDDALQDIREQIIKDEMPLTSYTILHWDARLSDEDREILLSWAR